MTLFCLKKRLLKHKMTMFSKNLGGGMAPLSPPGYAYGSGSDTNSSSLTMHISPLRFNSFINNVFWLVLTNGKDASKHAGNTDVPLFA